MMRKLFTFAFVPSLLICGGCGLVWFPMLQQCPGPVREVRVCDPVTGAPIRHSNVYWLVVPHEYKGYPCDGRQFWISVNDLESSHENREKERIYGQRIAEGRFRLDSKLLLAGWQWLWPLWSWATSGDFEYHGYATEIIVTAPGYAPGRILFAAGLDRRTFSEHADGDAEYRLGDRGVLSMFLQPLDLSPTTMPQTPGHASATTTR